MRDTKKCCVPMIEFTDGGMRGPKGEGGDAPRLAVEKIAPYLYKIESKDLDYSFAEAFIRKHYPSAQAGCSTVTKHGFLGHNYDTPYDETAEFVVRTLPQNGRHGSVGLASIPGVLVADMVDAERGSTFDEFTDEAYKVIPFLVVDGVNDAGVGVAVNWMNDEPEHEDPSDDSAMCSLFAARYILDNADSVQNALELLLDMKLWFPDNSKIKSAFYLTFYDGETTIFADLNGGYFSVDEDAGGVLTNFRTVEWAKTGDQTFFHNLHANGVERYHILEDGIANAQNESDLTSLLKSVRYTGAYQEREQEWYSDFNGDWTDIGFGDLTMLSAPEDYAGVIEHFRAAYSVRWRDGATKHTMHTAVYDIAQRAVSVMAQENDHVYRFFIDEAQAIADEAERAKAAENALRDEMYGNFYTMREVDNQIDILASDITDMVNAGLDKKVDSPEETGETGQMLVKAEEGMEWINVPEYLPEVTGDDNGKVMVVEDGEWTLTDKFADFIRYVNITVTIGANNGAIPASGLTVGLYDADHGDKINEARYEGQPVTFRVPRGMGYIIRQSGVWEGYHNPTPTQIENAATADASHVFTYEVITIPETLRQLQIIVDSGSAGSLAGHEGLQFEDTYEENGTEYSVVWDLKHVAPAFDEDGNVHTGVYLEWHNPAPTAMPYDAPELEQVDLETEPVAQSGVYYYGLSGTTYRLLTVNAGEALPTTYTAVYKNAVRSADGSILRRGLAKYDESVPRKWLNSDGTVGHWWEKTHVGDVAPNTADTIPGFKHGCSEQILSMVKPVRVATAVSGTGEISYVYDEFFIQSCEEMYGVNTVTGEGVAWQDWINATGMSAPSNDANSGRRIFPGDGAVAQEVGLRSVNTSYQYVTWSVKADGSLDGYINANVARKFTPCCVIYK